MNLDYLTFLFKLEYCNERIGLTSLGREKIHKINSDLYIFRLIKNKIFFFLNCPIKNEMFAKIETISYLFFHLSYFILSSFTQNTTT